MHDVVILGAGIHGLCAAFALRRRGRGVTLLDRFPAGHARGGSHGAARITRSSYDRPRYVELAQRVHRDRWPRLEAELGRALVHPTPGVFFGPPDGPFGDFLAATLAACTRVEQIDVQAAACAFPLLRFEPGDAVMLDHTAGVLAAGETVAGLREWLVAHDVAILDDTAARRLGPAPDGIVVETDSGTLRARSVVVATGAWLGELVPEQAGRINPLRQSVGYVRVAAPPEATALGSFPVWARIGRHAGDFAYGLPEFARPGLKIGLHRTAGPSDDPDEDGVPVDDGALLQLGNARFAAAVEALLASEHCMYAVAPEEELTVTRAAADPRIVAVAACSGHGFKFGPEIGEQVADLVAG